MQVNRTEFSDCTAPHSWVLTSSAGQSDPYISHLLAPVDVTVVQFIDAVYVRVSLFDYRNRIYVDKKVKFCMVDFC